MCVATQNRQQIHKTPYFSVQGYPKSLPMYDFLFVINSNLGPIFDWSNHITDNEQTDRQNCNS